MLGRFRSLRQFRRPLCPRAAPITAMSSFPLDRKAMEAERLARLASRKKRERSISPPPTRRPLAPVQEAATTLSSGAKVNFIFTPSTSQVEQDNPIIRKEEVSTDIKKEAPLADIKIEEPSAVDIRSEREPASSRSQDPALKYPHGVIKKTWAFGHDRKNDIKLEEVLEASTLKIAVLSAFRWDMQWLMPKLKTPGTGGRTKCVFVMEAKTEEFREQMRKETQEYSKFLQLCFPPMDGVWCMHSKLMLLFHPTKLRIAIPTANLLPFDWGDPINPGQAGIMENSVFLVDLPRLAEDARQNASQLPQFGQELLYFMKKQSFAENICDAILKFDFSATKEMAFVHTVGGSSLGDDAQRTGLLGLSKAVRDLGLAASPDLQLDFAASSIGALKIDYLKKFHAAACGQHMLVTTAAEEKKARAAFFQRTSDKKLAPSADLDVRQKLRIYFPTLQTVKASTAGNVGTICLQRKWYEDSAFPREIFRDYRSTRPGLLSHNKILCARGISLPSADGGHDEAPSSVAWVYIGSANMSPSAWGTIGKDSKGKMSCRNWECGVLLSVPPRSHSTQIPGIVTVKHEQADSDDPMLKISESTNAPVEQENEIDSDATESDVEESIKTQTSTRTVVKPEPGEGSETESDDEPAASDRIGKSTAAPVPTAGRRAVVIPDMAVFNTLLDLPFEVPAGEYHGREPWYFMEHA